VTVTKGKFGTTTAADILEFAAKTTEIRAEFTEPR
jgi:hypothetical protein